MDTDIIADTFESSQAAVDSRIHEILDAAITRDLDRLASYHLEGPKFSKFDDVEPLDRQDAETSARLEAEQFAAVQDLHAGFDDLKIDVFGPVAIATGIFVWDGTVDGSPSSGRTRSTVVFVDDGSQWLIAHEHHPRRRHPAGGVAGRVPELVRRAQPESRRRRRLSRRQQDGEPR
ncbi:nuclear transport factor 2 family protein [Kocuria nitroreducens]|uniref:nuclear transport factor 2 family protein n=1 Tax=Kocuria nitroreducens TaxID=3058914 RepID=UPI0036DD2E16